MPEIRVQETAADADRWVFAVRVGGDSGTRHEVIVPKAYAAKLGGGADAKGLVRRSFLFLLEREPKESILPRFELPVIGRYFPEYEDVIRS